MRGPASAPRLALSKATFPIAPEACAGKRRAPSRKVFVSRRCINIQMPLRITHCRALAVKVHRRFYSPATAPARSRVPCEGSPARRAASPRGRRGEPDQTSHSHFADGLIARRRAGYRAHHGQDLRRVRGPRPRRPAAHHARARDAGQPRAARVARLLPRVTNTTQARSSRRRTGASTSSPPASAPSSRPTASARTTWPTASRRPSARKLSRSSRPWSPRRSASSLGHYSWARTSPKLLERASPT